MKQPNIAVYGSKTCADTVRACRFLDSSSTPYEFKDVDLAPEYNDYVAGLNGGKRVIPTLRIDGDTLVNPSDEEIDLAVRGAESVREG